MPTCADEGQTKMQLDKNDNLNVYFLRLQWGSMLLNKICDRKRQCAVKLCEVILWYKVVYYYTTKTLSKPLFLKVKSRLLNLLLKALLLKNILIKNILNYTQQLLKTVKCGSKIK